MIINKLDKYYEPANILSNMPTANSAQISKKRQRIMENNIYL